MHAPRAKLRATMARLLGRTTEAGANEAHVCERCGSDMIEHHCKIRCPNCGYIRDCSDPRSPRRVRVR